MILYANYIKIEIENNIFVVFNFELNNFRRQVCFINTDIIFLHISIYNLSNESYNSVNKI